MVLHYISISICLHRAPTISEQRNWELVELIEYCTFIPNELLTQGSLFFCSLHEHTFCYNIYNWCYSGRRGEHGFKEDYRSGFNSIPGIEGL